MFDLEQALSKWRQQMAADGIERSDLLDELESHLCDDVDQRLRSGLNPEEAFQLAVEELGSSKALKSEFERIGVIREPAAGFRRVLLLERNIMLPIKAMVTVMLLYFFYTSYWEGVVTNTGDYVIQFARLAAWLYTGLSLALAVLLLAFRHLPLAWLRGVIFTSSLTDGLLLSSLCVLTGGYESVLYWVFLGLLVRNSISLPKSSSVLLNVCAIGCYALAGVFDHWHVRDLTPTDRAVLELYSVSTGNEQVFLRMLVLVLVAVCCFLIASILIRQRLSSRIA